ncbi:MAG: 9-O-acetylesterase, partial [Bacteroidaceae bacterium]|nr:9-O-acetylesterase [Bacteroidaceae bacterium]
MKKYLILLFMCLANMTAQSLELPDIIGSNMVLQQKSQAKLWGWAKPNSTIQVNVSWNNKRYSSKADSQSGRWDLQIETPSASYDAKSISIQGDGETVVLENVLIGEVWFCSGQSNMEMPLRGFWNCPV